MEHPDPDNVKIGDAVTFIDRLGHERAALVTAVWPGYRSLPAYGGKPGVNIVLVSDDTNRDDPYGRQVERETSIPHATGQPAPGYAWK